MIFLLKTVISELFWITRGLWWSSHWLVSVMLPRNDGTCPLLWWTSPSMDILQPPVVASGRASEWWISCSFLIFFGGSWAKRVWQHCFLLLFDASGSNQQTSSYIFVARAAASSSSGGSPADLLLHIPPHLRTIRRYPCAVPTTPYPRLYVPNVPCMVPWYPMTVPTRQSLSRNHA